METPAPPPTPIPHQHKIGTDKKCVYTRPGGSAQDRFSYPVPNGSTYESDPVWNYEVHGWYQDLENPIEFG